MLATTTYLKTGRTKSCGCLNRELASERLKTKKFENARKKYREEKFLIDGTSLALISSKKVRKNNTTSVPGVYWDKKLRKYRARICIKGKRINIGCFYKLEDAKKARERAEEKYFGPIIEDHKEVE